MLTDDRFQPNRYSQSKQGVSFGVIFSRNGISFVWIHFSGTGVESHITSDVAIVFEVGL
jgi:hypothetical protein